MKKDRRLFLKLTGMASLGIAGVSFANAYNPMKSMEDKFTEKTLGSLQDDHLSIIGQYGSWAASLTENKIPSHSFRNPKWNDLETWRKAAKERLFDRIAIPDIGQNP